MKKVHSNLLAQDVYVRDTVPKTFFCSHCREQEKNVPQLVEKIGDNGVTHCIEFVPYPHTPEAVKSYADSVDYRLDPLSAVNNGVQRPNLGDVTASQELSRMDSSEIIALRDRLQEAITKLNISQMTGSAPATEPAEGSEENDG